MEKFLKFLRPKKLDKENIFEDDIRDSKSNRHVKFGRKSKSCNNRNAFKSAYSDYEDDDDDSSVATLKQANIINPYSVVTEPKQAKSAKSWAGALEDEDRSKHIGRSRSKRFGRGSSALNDMHNRSFGTEFLVATSSQDQRQSVDFRNNSTKQQQQRFNRNCSPQQSRRGALFRERFADNGADINTNGAFVDYSNVGASMRKNRDHPSYILSQLSNSNDEMRMAHRIMKLETRVANYKERLVIATNDLRLEKREHEKLQKGFLKLCLDNQTMKSTIESQNEIIAKFKNDLDWHLMHSSEVTHRQQQQQQLAAQSNHSAGYSTAPTALLHSDTATMSSMGAGTGGYGIINAKLCHKNQNQRVKQNACGVRGSGESLANMSSSSPIGFSDTSDTSANISKNIRNEFNSIFNPITAATSAIQDQFQLQQLRNQLSLRRQQSQQRRNLQKVTGNFVNSDSNASYSKQQATIEGESTIKQNLFLTKSGFSQLGADSSPSVQRARVNYGSNFTTEEIAHSLNGNKFNGGPPADFGVFFNNMLQKNGNDGGTANSFYFGDFLSQASNTETHPNSTSAGYSALLTTPIVDDTGDEVKNFRSEHADSSRHDTDLEDLEQIKRNLVEESINSSSRGSTRIDSDVFSSPEVARCGEAAENSFASIQRIRSSTIGSCLDSTLTEGCSETGSISGNYFDSHEVESIISSTVFLKCRRKMVHECQKQCSNSTPVLSALSSTHSNNTVPFISRPKSSTSDSKESNNIENEYENKENQKPCKNPSKAVSTYANSEFKQQFKNERCTGCSNAASSLKQY